MQVRDARGPGKPGGDVSASQPCKHGDRGRGGSLYLSCHQPRQRGQLSKKPRQILENVGATCFSVIRTKCSSECIFQKKIKSAVEVARTYSTLLADYKLRRRLTHAHDPKEFAVSFKILEIEIQPMIFDDYKPF